jgi:hypothetical protein
MFRPPFVTNFREVFCEGYVTKNIKTNLKYNILGCNIYNIYYNLIYIYNTKY